MHENECLQRTISKFSQGAYSRTALGWLSPPGESGFALIYAACCAVITSAKNPDPDIGKTSIERQQHHGGFKPQSYPPIWDHFDWPAEHVSVRRVDK